MTARFFSNESEAERKQLFSKVELNGLGILDYQYLSYSGVLPVTLPDGLRVLVLPDTHAPYHNKLIFWAIFQFVKWFRPHIVVWIGDLNDLLAMSAWPKMPRTYVSAQREMDETRALVYKLYKLGVLWQFVIDGNHEDRMIRRLCRDIPQFAHYLDANTREPITSLPNLMGFRQGDPVTFLTGLDERGGFEGGLWVNDDYKLEHGLFVKPNGGDSVRAHAEKFGRNSGTGHTHRMGNFARRLMGAKVLRGTELGCLVDWDTPAFAYAPTHDWHHGFGVGTVAGGKLHMQPVPIIQSADEGGQLRYFFTYADKVFVSSDR